MPGGISREHPSRNGDFNRADGSFQIAGVPVGPVTLDWCRGFLTAAGLAPTKNCICLDVDPQLCYKTCGPESIGFKSETCAAGVYVEQSGCSFLTGQDYSCFKIPATIDPSCPTTVPQASTVCTVAACTPWAVSVPLTVTRKPVFSLSKRIVATARS